MSQNNNSNTSKFMIKATAAFAVLMMAAVPVSAQVGLPVGAPEVPAVPGVPGMPGLPATPDVGTQDVDTPAGSASVSQHGTTVGVCADASAAKAHVDGARAQAESAAAPVTSQVDAARATAEGHAATATGMLPVAVPAAPELPVGEDDIPTDACESIDALNAQGEVAEAQEKAGGLVAKIQGFFGSLRGALPF